MQSEPKFLPQTKKRGITEITNSQNAKKTNGETSEQLWVMLTSYKSRIIDSQEQYV